MATRCESLFCSWVWELQSSHCCEDERRREEGDLGLKARAWLLQLQVDSRHRRELSSIDQRDCIFPNCTVYASFKLYCYFHSLGLILLNIRSVPVLVRHTPTFLHFFYQFIIYVFFFLITIKIRSSPAVYWHKFLFYRLEVLNLSMIISIHYDKYYIVHNSYNRLLRGKKFVKFKL